MARFWEEVAIDTPKALECGWRFDECASGVSSHNDIMSMLLESWIFYLLIVAIISFLITLWFYFLYRHKKDEYPWKHAVKRSWSWWIIILLVPIYYSYIMIYNFSLRLEMKGIRILIKESRNIQSYMVIPWRMIAIIIIWLVLITYLIYRKHKWEKWLWKKILLWDIIFFFIMLALIAIMYYEFSKTIHLN